MTLTEALQAVIKGPDSQLIWAKNYAHHALHMISEGLSAKEVAIQLLYLDNNLRSWRGDVAREAKKVIRQFIKENK